MNALSPPTSEPNRATPRTLPVCPVAFNTPAAMADRDFSTTNPYLAARAEAFLGKPARVIPNYLNQA
jgi:hypothetical protein